METKYMIKQSIVTKLSIISALAFLTFTGSTYSTSGLSDIYAKYTCSKFGKTTLVLNKDHTFYYESKPAEKGMNREIKSKGKWGFRSDSTGIIFNSDPYEIIETEMIEMYEFQDSFMYTIIVKNESMMNKEITNNLVKYGRLLINESDTLPFNFGDTCIFRSKAPLESIVLCYKKNQSEKLIVSNGDSNKYYLTTNYNFKEPEYYPVFNSDTGLIKTNNHLILDGCSFKCRYMNKGK